MKVLICGDRNWKDPQLINDVIVERLTLPFTDHTIIEGEARGADILARNIGERLGIPVDRVPADWEKFGKAAGPIRNWKMLNKNPDEVWAFHDNLGSSKGTADMVKKSVRYKIKTLHFSHHWIGGRELNNVESHKDLQKEGS